MAYLVAFVVHWTLLAIVVAVRLWRAGRRQPSVARRRMQTLSAASAAITLALVVAAAGPEEGSLGAVACFQLVIPHGGDGDDVSAHRLFRAAGSPAVARTR